MSNESKIDLEERLAKLEERVQELENFTFSLNPGIPDPVKVWPSFPPPYDVSQGIWKQCPKCGLKLDGILSYNCANIGCPTGLGPLMC